VPAAARFGWQLIELIAVSRSTSDRFTPELAWGCTRPPVRVVPLAGDFWLLLTANFPWEV